MTINELKIACYLYERFTGFDIDYINLIQVGNLDLTRANHINSLIKWLRKWGCRQFKVENTNMSIRNLQQWYLENLSRLPELQINLHSCTDEYIINFVQLFNSLANTKISERNNNNKLISVSVGAVGAAKILFALRPNVFSPWDKPIYKHLKYHSTGESYVSYLINNKKLIIDLQTECEQNGFEITDLPQRINRPISTFPKIIDEFNWVNITRNCSTSEMINLILNKRVLNP